MSVSLTEKRKAAFLDDYKKLCTQHGMMVIMCDVETVADETYASFEVADIYRAPRAFEQAMEEMRIREVARIQDEDVA